VEYFEIRLLDVIAIIRRRWLPVLICTFVGIAVSATLAFTVTKTYRIEAVLIAVAGQQPSISESLLGQLGGLGSLAGTLMGSASSTQEEAIAFLQSRAFTRDFILNRDLLPVLFAASFDESMTEKDGHAEDMPTIWDGVMKFENHVRKVERDRVSGLIRFAIEWSDPQTALEWNRDLVSEVNSRLRKRAIDEAETNIGYLDKQLELTSVAELRQAIYDLMESQIKAAMLAQAQTDYAFRVVDPPLMPDPDEFVRPQRVLYIFIGSFFGFLLGAGLALYLDRHRLTDDGRA
jgi:uncharacterized protein involved in exopolysaccharide biosynthesis